MKAANTGGRAAAEEDVPPTQLLSTNAEFQHFLSSQCALPPYLSSLCDAASSGIGTRSLPAAAEGLREALVQVTDFAIKEINLSLSRPHLSPLISFLLSLRFSSR